MNMNKAFEFIAEHDIKPEVIFSLVEKVRNMDLSDESNIREIIQEVSKIANKPIDKTMENKIVQDIQKNGVNDKLFDYLA